MPCQKTHYDVCYHSEPTEQEPEDPEPEQEQELEDLEPEPDLIDYFDVRVFDPDFVPFTGDEELIPNNPFRERRELDIPPADDANPTIQIGSNSESDENYKAFMPWYGIRLSVSDEEDELSYVPD